MRNMYSCNNSDKRVKYDPVHTYWKFIENWKGWILYTCIYIYVYIPGMLVKRTFIMYIAKAKYYTKIIKKISFCFIVSFAKDFPFSHICCIYMMLYNVNRWYISMRGNVIFLEIHFDIHYLVYRNSPKSRDSRKSNRTRVRGFLMLCFSTDSENITFFVNLLHGILEKIFKITGKLKKKITIKNGYKFLSNVK